MIKRAFDVTAAACALLLLLPLLLPIAVVLRLTGEGEVFYGQKRIGRRGKQFSIYKFATMLKNSPNLAGGDITIGEDSRILPFGRVLRKSKINELPQLANILLGDMSIIGPRPLTPRVSALFPQAHREAIAVLRPGLSGVGSLVFRDEETLLEFVEDRERVYSTLIVPYKMALEEWYLHNQSFVLDSKLILLTAMAICIRNINIERLLPELPSPSAEFLALRRNQVRAARSQERIIRI